MAPPVLPRLKQSIDIFAAAAGEVHLYRGGEEDFVVEGETAGALALLHLLDGQRQGVEIRTSLSRAGHGIGPDELGTILVQLVDAGLVEDAADDDVLTARDRSRYDRQLRYFSDCAPAGASRAQYQLRLKQAHVVVLGVGGLGGWSALALASAGIGRLTLVDGDSVELSNLNRQVLYSEADIGRRKAAAAAARLRAFNSDLSVESVAAWLRGAGDIERLVSGADFVVDAVDTPVHRIESWVNEACFAAAVPYIAMSQFPPLVRVGPMFVPGQTGCYACQEAEWRERYPMFDELAAHRQQHPSPAASFGPASGLVGAQVACEVTHFLAGIARPVTLGHSVVVDIRTLEAQREEVRQRAECRVCGGRARPRAAG